MAQNNDLRIIKCGSASLAVVVRHLAAKGELEGAVTVHLLFGKGKCHILTDCVGDIDVEKLEDAFAFGAAELASFIRHKKKATGTVH